MKVAILNKINTERNVYIKLEYNTNGEAEVVVCNKDGIREAGGHLLKISDCGITLCKAVNRKFGFAQDDDGYLHCDKE